MKAYIPKGKGFRRTRFLAAMVISSPAVLFVYTPLAIALAVLGAAVPFATGRFIDALVAGGSPWNAFAVLAGVLAVKGALAPCLQRLVFSRARETELELQRGALDSIMNRSPSSLALLANGELVAKLTRDAYAVGGFISGLYPRLLTALVTMVTAGCALCSRSVTLAFSFVVFIPLSIVLFIPFARRFAANSHAVRSRSDKAFSVLFDFLNSLHFLRTLDAQRRFADAPDDSLRSLKEGNSAADRLGVVFGALLGGILIAGEIGVLAVAGAFAAQGKIPVGDVVVYQMLFLVAIQSIQGIVSLLPESSALREGIDSLIEIGSYQCSENGGEELTSVETLEFRNVSFAYPGGKKIIAGFSAVLHKGKAVAVTGVNGAGKTTLLKLAIGALEPQEGEVLVNGKRIGSFDESSFRRSIGVVFQDSLLVTGTVRDNITLRDPSFTEEDIMEAVAESGLVDVIKRLPAGLDTFVGLWGQSLSGGELQRLAIARALIRKPGIMVLDEVTNHLDAEARKAFAGLLESLAETRIVLLVTHDESLAGMCGEKIFCQISEKPSYISMHEASALCIG